MLRSKVCGRCKKRRALRFFYANPNARYESNKHSNYCRTCFREYHKQRTSNIRASEPDQVDSKVCRGCKQEKPAVEFHTCFFTRDHLQTRCKECLKKQYPHNRGARYGLTKEQVETMHEDQKGLCAICGRPESRTYFGKNYIMCIDHDHETNKPRKLLCSFCNYAIGGIEKLFRYGLLDTAVEYLRQHGVRAGDSKPPDRIS